MHFTWDASTLGALIPIVGMLIPIVAIIAGVVQWWHGEQLRHDTIRELARSGQSIPAELLKGNRSDESPNSTGRGSRVPGSLRTGLILLSIGLALTIALYMVSPEEAIWGFGLIPTFLGVAFLVIWRIESRARV
jgi:hypothetical protein